MRAPARAPPSAPPASDRSWRWRAARSSWPPGSTRPARRTADEGRSVFSKPGGGSRVGEKVANESVTLRSDPFDPRVPATPWNPGGGPGGGSTDGLPNRKVTWIDQGVLKTLVADRYWARVTGVEPTPI